MAEGTRSARKTGWLRWALRIVIPAVMLGLGAFTASAGGLRALWVLVPILAIHVLVALVVIPVWVRFRRRRDAAPVPGRNPER